MHTHTFNIYFILFYPVCKLWLLFIFKFHLHAYLIIQCEFFFIQCGSFIASSSNEKYINGMICISLKGCQKAIPISFLI